MPKFDAKYLNNLRNRKKERLDDFEVKLKEQNSDPKYAVTIGEFCKSEFELNASQYQTANSTNKDLTLNSLLYYYFFLNEKSKNDEFLEEKGAMKQFFNSIDITDKQLEAIGQYANKEKRILADIEDIGKDGTEISESNRRKDEVLKKQQKQEEKQRKFEEAKNRRILEKKEKPKQLQEEIIKPVIEVENNNNTMASFVEGKDIQLFEGFLYEKSNRQYAGTDYDFINIANQATESVRDKTTDELISAFNENFGLGEKPTEKETEIKNKVANQIKAKEEISLPDAKVFNNWTRKTYGYPKSIENVSKGIAQYNAVNKKYQKRLFSRWFEWTGLFPEATKEKKALEKMKNHMEGVLNVPVEKISKSLADGKQLSDLVADLSRKEDHPIFMNKKMNELFPQKESDLDSKAIDIPNELFENKDININLNNDLQLEQVKENEKVIE